MIAPIGTIVFIQQQKLREEQYQRDQRERDRKKREEQLLEEIKEKKNAERT